MSKMKQVFIAFGNCPDHGAQYFYAFDDPDEAMLFVEKAEAHDDDAVNDWTIITLTNKTAEGAYAEHRAWVEE